MRIGGIIEKPNNTKSSGTGTTKTNSNTPKQTITPNTAVSPPPSKHDFGLLVMLTKKTAPLYANKSVQKETLAAYKKDCLHKTTLALRAGDLETARNIAIEYHATILLLDQQDNPDYRGNRFYPLITGIASGKDFIQLVFNPSEKIFSTGQPKQEETANNSNVFSSSLQKRLAQLNNDREKVFLNSQEIQQLIVQDTVTNVLTHVDTLLQREETQTAVIDYENYLGTVSASDQEYEKYYALQDTYQNPSASTQEKALAGKKMMLIVLKHKQKTIKTKIRREFKKIVKKHRKEIDKHFDQGNQDLVVSIDGTVYCIERHEKGNKYVYVLKSGDSLEETARISLSK